MRRRSCASFRTSRLLELLVVSFADRAHRLDVDASLGVLEAQHALELAVDVARLEQLDLLDQPIEAQAYGRIRDAVDLRQLLERARSEQEAADEREVFILEVLEPRARIAPALLHRFSKD